MPEEAASRTGGISMMGNGFLPSVHQASLIHPGRAEPLRNIVPSASDARQRRQLNLVRRMDEDFLASVGGNEPIEAAIANYETAYRMQSAVPELVDLASETEATRKLYGVESPNPSTAAYAKQCLLARRLVERGVRFVELTMVSTPGKSDGMGNPWGPAQQARTRSRGERPDGGPASGGPAERPQGTGPAGRKRW